MVNKNTFLILGAHNIYVCNFNGGEVRRFGGRSGFSPQDGCFNEPSGITIDSFGNMIISDSKNHRLQVYIIIIL